MTTPQDPFGPPSDRPGGAPDPGQPYGAPPPTYGQPPEGPPYGQQQYGQQQWGAPGGSGPKRNGLGIAALVLGLLAVVTSFTLVGGIVLGLAAIVLGVLGRGRAKRGEADNGGMAIAGIVLGVIGVLLSAAFIAAGVALFSSDSGQSLVDCLENAAGDPAAEQQCEQEFAEDLGQ